MNSVDELMRLHSQATDVYADRFDSAEHMRRSVGAHNNLYYALTTTLAEKDARIVELTGRTAELNHRIAELEDDNAAQRQLIIDLGNRLQKPFPLPLMAPPKNNDRRRFVDDSAKLNMAQLIATQPLCDENLARDSYDAAEALAAERDRRMQG